MYCWCKPGAMRSYSRSTTTTRRPKLEVWLLIRKKPVLGNPELRDAPKGNDNVTVRGS